MNESWSWFVNLCAAAVDAFSCAKSRVGWIIAFHPTNDEGCVDVHPLSVRFNVAFTGATIDGAQPHLVQRQAGRDGTGIAPVVHCPDQFGSRNSFRAHRVELGDARAHVGSGHLYRFTRRLHFEHLPHFLAGRARDGDNRLAAFHRNEVPR